MTMGVSDSLNLLRTLRMAIFGLFLLGPTQHVWFNFLGRILPKRDMTTTFKKLVVGQIFYGPSCTAVFFIYNASLQGMSRFLQLYKLEFYLLLYIFHATKISTFEQAHSSIKLFNHNFYVFGVVLCFETNDLIIAS